MAGKPLPPSYGIQAIAATTALNVAPEATLKPGPNVISRARKVTLAPVSTCTLLVVVILVSAAKL